MPTFASTAGMWECPRLLFLSRKDTTLFRSRKAALCPRYVHHAWPGQPNLCAIDLKDIKTALTQQAPSAPDNFKPADVLPVSRQELRPSASKTAAPAPDSGNVFFRKAESLERLNWKEADGFTKSF